MAAAWPWASSHAAAAGGGSAAALGARITAPRGAGRFRCPECGKLYHWKNSLYTHLRLECGKEPQFQCPFCPYRAKLKGNLQKHVSNKHGASPTATPPSPLPQTPPQLRLKTDAAQMAFLAPLRDEAPASGPGPADVPQVPPPPPGPSAADADPSPQLP